MAATNLIAAVDGMPSVVPAGTDLTGGISLSAFSPTAQTATSITLNRQPTGLQLVWATGGTSLPSFFAPGAGSTGVHDVVLTLTSAEAAAGLLSLDWTLSATVGCAASVAVDVGDDGVVDFAASSSTPIQTMPVVWGPGVLRVRITSQSLCLPAPFLAGMGRLQSTLQLDLAPHPACAVQARGTSCGPDLLARDVPFYGVEFRGTGLTAAPAGLAFLVLGLQSWDQPLPIAGSAGCRQYTDLVAVELLQVQPSGDAVWRLDTSMLGGIAFHGQIVDLHAVPARVRTSQAVRVVCP